MHEKNTLYHPTIASTNGFTMPQTNTSAKLQHNIILVLPQMLSSSVDTPLRGRFSFDFHSFASHGSPAYQFLKTLRDIPRHPVLDFSTLSD